MVGICRSSVTLIQLTQALVSTEVKGLIDLTNVINLDGGPSTGFVYQVSDQPSFHFPQGWTVRNFIFVVPRTENREQRTENREQRTENSEQLVVCYGSYY